MIPIYLVSSTMDSIRWRVVLFKPVTILTSDPRSEFLCQLSLCCAEPADPLNHLVCLGYLPCPQTPRIIHTLTVQVFSQSTLSTSYAHSGQNILVAASRFKSNRMFPLNITPTPLQQGWDVASPSGWVGQLPEGGPWQALWKHALLCCCSEGGSREPHQILILSKCHPFIIFGGTHVFWKYVQCLKESHRHFLVDHLPSIQHSFWCINSLILIYYTPLATRWTII